MVWELRCARVISYIVYFDLPVISLSPTIHSSIEIFCNILWIVIAMYFLNYSIHTLGFFKLFKNINKILG